MLFLSVNLQSISIFRLEVLCRKEERLRLQEEERFRKEEETRLQKEGGLTWAEKNRIEYDRIRYIFNDIY